MTPATLAVLAGGAGSRMGRPKGLLTLGGAPILGRLLDQLAWPGPTLLVTAPGRERPPGHDRFDAEATDPVAGEGPLRGVLTALDAATTPVTVVVTVDMPGVTRAQLDWIIGRFVDDEVGAMTSRRGATVQQMEPFPLVLRATAAATVRSRLGQGRRSVHGLADEPGFVVRPAPQDWPASVWANLNTPEDLARFGG